MEKQLEAFFKYLKKQPPGFVYGKIMTKEEKLKQLQKKFTNCQKCPLAKQGRTQIVFGEGSANAKLMFIGEGPGREEDQQGKPFVGKAGKLLTKILQAMNLTRKDIYITNVVKCRPPNNRAPLPNESEICKNLILFREIDIIKPKIICTLGASATQALLGNDIKISKKRGLFFKYKDIEVMPTFHPAYLLRNPEAKKLVWEDMKKILKKLKN